MKRILAVVFTAIALAAGSSIPALASEAHPAPNASCSILGSRGVYHIPHRHNIYLLRCERYHSQTIWRVVGYQ